MRIKINDEKKDTVNYIATILEIGAMVLVIIIGIVFLKDRIEDAAYQDGYKDGYEQGEKSSVYIQEYRERS